MFGWGQDPEPQTGTGETPSADGHPCPSLVKAIERVLKEERPRILDLGPLCGNTVVELARRGARVTVDEFDPPAVPEPVEGEDETPVEPLCIDQPDRGFDLVLAWEHIDFVPPERVDEFVAELKRVTAPGGAVLLLTRTTGDVDADYRARYRLLDEQRIVREPLDEELRARWVHPNRRVEQALSGFEIQGVHLQRDQTREYLVVRKAGAAEDDRTGRPAGERPAKARRPTTSRPRASLGRRRPIGTRV